jgi:hypothetical protein
MTGTEVALVRQLATPVVVMVSPDDGGWVAEIVALGVVRRAPGLAAVDAQVRDLLGTDIVDYQFHTGDTALDRLVTRICRTAPPLRRSSGETLLDLTALLRMPDDQLHQMFRRCHGGAGQDRAAA